MHEYFHRETEKKKAIKGIEEYKNLTEKIREKKDWISEDAVNELLEELGGA